MGFVAYLVGLVAAFIGVFALYGTLMKPFTTTLQEPIGPAVEEHAAPQTTQAVRTPSRGTPSAQPSPDSAEASEARAEEEQRHRVPQTSRRSPVAAERDGLRLKPERCWIVTDSTRNYGYYGECR